MPCWVQGQRLGLGVLLLLQFCNANTPFTLRLDGCFPKFFSNHKLRRCSEGQEAHRQERRSHAHLFGGLPNPSRRYGEEFEQISMARKSKKYRKGDSDSSDVHSIDDSVNAASDDADQPQKLNDGILLGAYLRYHATVKIRQICEIGTEVWCHLPPVVPPFLVISSIPRRVTVEDSIKYVVPLVSNKFVRNLVIQGAVLGSLAWANAEYFKKRRLSPLPMLPEGKSVSQVFLPPFLPEEGPYAKYKSKEIGDSDRRKRRILVRAEKAAKRRQEVYDQLLAKQNSIRKSNVEHYSSLDNLSVKAEQDGDFVPSGYALVTGASQGIGRAIAIELARWQIPSILVARDIDKLTSLAYDIEACYGIKCYVMQADLSQPKAAERIYRATKKARLSVPIVVNNAGFGWEGELTDMETSSMHQMINLNVMAYSKLARLFGEDMKANGFGRLLMVSSVAGTVECSPHSALYAATKSFGRSLSLSMAKEMEPYGVGVTCLMPGPVGDTKFRSSSDSFVWKIPLFPSSAQQVAHQGVLGMLDGDTIVRPGIVNRLWCEVGRLQVPTRLESIAVETIWKPTPSFLSRSKESNAQPQADHDLLIAPTPDLKPRFEGQRPPQLIRIPPGNRTASQSFEDNPPPSPIFNT